MSLRWGFPVFICVYLCLAFGLSKGAEIGRGRPFYDEPDYDLGLPHLTAPNQPTLDDHQFLQARRTHRPQSTDDPFAGSMLETRSDRRLPQVSNTPSQLRLNMRYRQPLPNLARALRFRDRSRSSPMPSFVEEQGSHHNINAFYGKTASRIEPNPLSDVDDPFGGEPTLGAGIVPTTSIPIPRAQAFEAPAFAEVVSQIKEIVAHPHSGGDRSPTARHMISSVVPAPQVAPPMAPPPIPRTFREGPPLPSLVQVTSTSRFGPPPTTTTRLVDPSPVGQSQVDPVLLENPMAPTPSAKSRSRTPKPLFLLETEEEVQERQRAADKKRAELEALERKRNPTSIPFVEHDRASQGHSFVEELAGVRKSVTHSKRLASLPPPLVIARTADNPHHSFRHWD